MSEFGNSARPGGARDRGQPRYHAARVGARIAAAVLALALLTEPPSARAESSPQPSTVCKRVRYRRPYDRVPVWVVDLLPSSSTTPAVGARSDGDAPPRPTPAAAAAAPALVFRTGLQVRADGAPNAYCRDDRGLDYAAKAGWPRGYWEKRLWRAPGATEPKLQDGSSTEPATGCFVSMTALRRTDLAADKPGAYVDSRRIPYVVLPADLVRHAPHGLALGDLVLAWSNPRGSEPRIVVAVLADVDERDHLGGGSIALAEALGLPSDPKSGGTRADTITYAVFPGTAGAFPAQASALNSERNRLIELAGGASRLLACGAPD